MLAKAPGSIGINPTIALYTVVLGGACAVAAYTERYRRDQDEIDGILKERYYSNMREQQAKMPQITQSIRGQDMRLDRTMNNLVWGGKASVPESGTGGSGEGGNASLAVAAESSSSKEETSSSSSAEEGWDSGSSSEEDLEEEKTLSKKERRRRRKERKLKREERRKKQQEAERQKLVVQSVAAGAAVGAVAVAASLFLGSGRK